MKNSKVLEMLNENRIEELKLALQDELYSEELAKQPGAKKRYAAMKKYFKLLDIPRECCQKPCAIEFNGENYNAFTNSYSLILTKESCGELQMFDTTNGNYPEISRLIDISGPEEKIDFNKVLAEAKSKGYKFKKSSIMSNEYLFHLNDSYFRMGLLDSSYRIIASEGEASIYHVKGRRSKLTIVNDIGICVIMPVYLENGPEEYYTVIES